MPRTPYPIDGVVYDRDGTTLVSGATVIILDVNLNEKISAKTNASGEFLLDLANLTSDYSNGDKIQVTAVYGLGSAQRSLSKRHTVVTATGYYSAGDMVLHAGSEPFADSFITFVSHSNSHSAGLYVDFYDRKNDAFVFRVESTAASATTGDTAILPIGYLGVKMDGGFIRVFESETAGRSEVLTVFK